MLEVGKGYWVPDPSDISLWDSVMLVEACCREKFLSSLEGWGRDLAGGCAVSAVPDDLAAGVGDLRQAVEVTVGGFHVLRAARE